MLTNFRVQNFKVFKDTGEVELKPLTMLSGINSAGKSSIIQALLLLKQTLESPPSMALAPGRGRLLEQSLGDNFSDFIYQQPELQDAALTYHLSFAFNQEQDAALYDDASSLGKELNAPFCGSALTATLQVTFRWGAFGFRGRPTVRVSKLRITLTAADEKLVGLEISPTDSGGSYHVKADPRDTAQYFQNMALSSLEIDGLSNFLPNALVLGSESLFTIYAEAIPLSFLKLFRDCFAAVRRDLSDEISYLNSFRKQPERIYSTGQTAGRMLDTNGGNVAEVIWQLREEHVVFVDADGHKLERGLPDMVDFVMREVLDLRQRVRIEALTPDVLQVNVETLGPNPIPVTLADVGLGYNQILPVVVQGLLTPPGGLVIFEQPEIHLHPDVQARLIAFFVGLAKSGRKVLVETHSSHMIEYLCLAIAQDQTNWLAKNARTLFVHAPSRSQASARIVTVEITPYGEILNWPDHFLPDIAELDEKILKAGFAKQRAERESKR